MNPRKKVKRAIESVPHVPAPVGTETQLPGGTRDSESNA